MFDQLHTKLEGLEGGGGGGVGGGGWGVVGGGGGGGGVGGGKFHTLGQGLREEVERMSKQNHRWESYNVDQLVCLWETSYMTVCICMCMYECTTYTHTL